MGSAMLKESQWRSGGGMFCSSFVGQLLRMGFSSTVEYVGHLARRVMEATGLLPHINAGVMSVGEMRSLRGVSASQGLMLESTAPQLMLPGGPHNECPDKEPDARLGTIHAAGGRMRRRSSFRSFFFATGERD